MRIQPIDVFIGLYCVWIAVSMIAVHGNERIEFIGITIPVRIGVAIGVRIAVAVGVPVTAGRVRDVAQAGGQQVGDVLVLPPSFTGWHRPGRPLDEEGHLMAASTITSGAAWLNRRWGYSRAAAARRGALTSFAIMGLAAAGEAPAAVRSALDTLAGLDVEAHSVGGLETCIHLPELRVAFDIGEVEVGGGEGE